MSVSVPAEQACPYLARVSSLARGGLSATEQTEIESHLERDETCRAQYRHETDGRFPTIPNYTILRQIDKGGFGVVYKAIHHTKERVEALKVLRDQAPLIASYFENEVHLIARLRHPHIATLFEAQLADPPLYYTMEYVDGVRLNDFVRDRPCSVAQRVEIIRTVAVALQYAHDHGVVHRDIKPQNILIDAEGQPHIVDFGIAQRLRPADRHAEPAPTDDDERERPIGTRGYMAPEQAQGKPVDARADIFALGVLLFTALTQEPPRVARDAAARPKLLRDAGAPRAADLERIIAHCVARDPAERYPSCRALADDLSNYMSGRPVAACARPARLYRARRQAALLLRDRPARVLAALVAGSAVLLTLAAWVGQARTLVEAPPQRTVLIAFTDATVAAIRAGRIGGGLPGLSANNPKSWRMLHGRLMERLAGASPRVVAFDYFFPDAQPSYDAHFVRGAERLNAPVIVGAKTFDREGTPRIAPSIAAAVEGVGALYAVAPDRAPHEYEVVHALDRGYDRPRLSLPLLTFAAARFGDAEPQVAFDRGQRALAVHYRRRDPQAGDRWHEASDRIPVYHLQPVQHNDEYAYMRAGDRVAHGRVPVRPLASWQRRTIAYEDVLQADAGRLREWFDGQVVLVGQMRPGQDAYQNGYGERIFGCHVQGDTIDALLGQAQTVRMSRLALAVRMLAWCGAVGVCLALASRGMRKALGAAKPVAAVCTALFVAGVALTYAAAYHFTQVRMVEAGLAGGALLACGSLAYWAGHARRREMLSAPAAVVPSPAPTTLSSTLLVEAGSA